MSSSALPAAVLDRRRALRLSAASVLTAGAAVGLSAPAGAAAADRAPILAVTAVRAGASATARTKFTLHPGALVRLTGNRKNGFTGVSHERGYGWVAAAHVGRLGEDAVAAARSALDVRATASASGAVKFRIPSGEQVGFTGNVKGSWTGVRHADGYGWAPTARIGTVRSGTLSTVAVAPTGLGETLAAVPVRSTSSPTGPVKFSLPAGTMVRYLGTRRAGMVGVACPRGYGWVPRGTVGPTARRSHPATAYQRSHTADGRSYGYHVVAEGIDPTRPIGMVVYLEGDYWYAADSVYKNPRGAAMTAMAREANRRNMVLVVPQTPRPLRSGYGYIWWHSSEREGNNVWLSALLERLYAGYPMLDRSRHWFLGYSGGAEFATFEFYARRPESVVSGGGAVLVAGGGMHDAPGKTTFYSLPSAAFRRSVHLQWYVGDQDGVGSTNPPTWSAYRATQIGEQTYRAAGFTRTSRTVLTGLDHGEYDLAGLLARGLGRAGVAALR